MGEALRTDMYQLTMMQAYWKSGHDDIEYLRTQGFDSEFLKHLRNFRFTGDILAMPEGSIAFPLEPIIRVTAPIMEAQLIETFLLNKMNFSTLIATKASRVVYAARGRAIAEFGLRRAQGDGHLEATRATYIGGCDSTSNVLAGKKLGIPISGTMAHSFVTSFDHEIDSYRAYAEAFPKKCFLLIDTYNSIEGAKKAVIVGKELEQREEKLVGVRLDSGDLAELSKHVRRILDDAGLGYVKIVASGDLNEWKIDELMNKGARIDLFGVGTELVTGRPTPALDGIYKLSDVVLNSRHMPKMKLSDDTIKATLPGKKRVLRIVKKGKFVKDVISLDDEFIDNALPLLEKVVENGKIICNMPSLEEIRNNARENLLNLPDIYKKIDGAPVYPVEFSMELVELREHIIEKIRMEELS